MTIVEFENAETHRAWATHAAHVGAQQVGRERFYAEYSIQVCEVVRSTRFSLES